MIPKIIHYCWFGGAEKPQLAKKCIKSWKKYCKGYKIVEWNENNFDLSTAPLFVQDAYKAKKWAFVTDYVRLKVVCEHGGIYLDTDVELIKRIDNLLECKSFFGIQFDLDVNTGLGFGAEKNSMVVRDLVNVYENGNLCFNEDNMLSFACPLLNGSIFKKYGYVKEDKNQILTDGIFVYATEYFCPMNFDGVKRITKNTISIHHYAATWQCSEQEYKKRIKLQRGKERKNRIKRFFNIKFWAYKILGKKIFNKLKNKIKK